MVPIAFSFRGIYFHEEITPYTISGNAMVIPVGHAYNKTGKDLLFVTYWAHEFIQGIDKGAARVILTLDEEIWNTAFLKEGKLYPIQSTFLNWLKDLVVKNYEKEKENPSQLSPYSPGEDV